uniref:Uncharacterized protein n=1 Tax=Sipha flava TaxID=143950 RepID=A0A2S2Q4D9_9HEMI
MSVASFASTESDLLQTGIDRNRFRLTYFSGALLYRAPCSRCERFLRMGTRRPSSYGHTRAVRTHRGVGAVNKRRTAVSSVCVCGPRKTIVMDNIFRHTPHAHHAYIIIIIIIIIITIMMRPAFIHILMNVSLLSLLLLFVQWLHQLC